MKITYGVCQYEFYTDICLFNLSPQNFYFFIFTFFNIYYLLSTKIKGRLFVRNLKFGDFNEKLFNDVFFIEIKK